MPLPLLLQVVLWSSFALCFAVILALSIWVFVLASEDNVELEPTLAIIPGYLIAIGFLVCVLAALGYPSEALYTWRIAGLLLFCLAVVRTIVILSGHLTLKASWLTIPAAVLVLLFEISGWMVKALPGGSGRVQATTYALPSLAVLAGSRFWHAVLYFVLVLLTLLFGGLFIRSSSREGPPSLERHWGGLGATSGGWEISSSLTYLLATIATASIFVSLLMQGDKPQQTSAGTAPSSVTQPAAAVTQPAAGSEVTKPAASKSAPANTAPANPPSSGAPTREPAHGD